MGASQLSKTTAIKKHYRGLGRAVSLSQIQAHLYFQKAAICIVGPQLNNALAKAIPLKHFQTAVRRFHSIKLHSSA
jgi:hypothetical protein